METIKIYDTWNDLIEVRQSHHVLTSTGEICVINFHESDYEGSDYVPMFLNEKQLKELIAALQQFLPQESQENTQDAIRS